MVRLLLVVATLPRVRGLLERLPGTWQPATTQDVYPRLLHSALALEPGDVGSIERAHGVLIGQHATRRKYAPRAGSVGGTHFVAVAGTQTADTRCAGG